MPRSGIAREGRFIANWSLDELHRFQYIIATILKQNTMVEGQNSIFSIFAIPADVTDHQQRVTRKRAVPQRRTFPACAAFAHDLSNVHLKHGYVRLEIRLLPSWSGYLFVQMCSNRSLCCSPKVPSGSASSFGTAASCSSSDPTVGTVIGLNSSTFFGSTGTHIRPVAG